jgi:hypothetical protein
LQIKWDYKKMPTVVKLEATGMHCATGCLNIVLLDKQEPDTGRIRGLNMDVAVPVTNCQ